MRICEISEPHNITHVFINRVSRVEKSSLKKNQREFCFSQTYCLNYMDGGGQ